jgi:hypothetical protein
MIANAPLAELGGSDNRAGVPDHGSARILKRYLLVRKDPRA